MKKAYARWMNAWEQRLCDGATDRVVRPFEWGLDWTHDWPQSNRMPRNGHDPHAYLQLLRKAGIETTRVATTGVLGRVRGAPPGHNVALRAGCGATPML